MLITISLLFIVGEREERGEKESKSGEVLGKESKYSHHQGSIDVWQTWNLQFFGGG